MNDPVLLSFVIVYNAKNWDKLFVFAKLFIDENRNAITYYHLYPKFKRGDSVSFVCQTSSNDIEFLARKANDSFDSFFKNNPSETPERREDSNPFLLNFPNNTILFFPNSGLYPSDPNLKGSFKLIDGQVCQLLENISAVYMGNVIEDNSFPFTWSKAFEALKYSLLLLKKSNIENLSLFFSTLLESSVNEEIKENTFTILHERYMQMAADLHEFICEIDGEESLIDGFFSSRNYNFETQNRKEMYFIVESIFSIFGLTQQEIIYMCYFAKKKFG